MIGMAGLPARVIAYKALGSSVNPHRSLPNQKQAFNLVKKDTCSVIDMGKEAPRKKDPAAEMYSPCNEKTGSLSCQ